MTGSQNNFTGGALAPLFAAQLDMVFASGVVGSFAYRRAGTADVPFSGVVDQFPARLFGVNPGDIRVRVRAAELSGVVGLGAADVVVETGSGISWDVISTAAEFGGLGITLQCRLTRS